MKIATIIARILVGGMFTFSGLNFFFGWVSMGGVEGEHAKAFMTALFMSKMFIPIKIVELAGGLTLLGSIFLRRFAPLGLLLLGPVNTVIVLYHIFMDPKGLLLPLILLLLQGFLLFAYRDHFRGILEPEKE